VKNSAGKMERDGDMECCGESFGIETMCLLVANFLQVRMVHPAKKSLP